MSEGPSQAMLDKATAGGYDYIDLGCSKGGGSNYCVKRWKKKGLGVDRDPKKVRESNKHGFEAYTGDALKTPFPDNSFRYAVLMDFLEHLPDLEHGQRAINEAKRLAKDFIFIRNPSFEDESYLAAEGLMHYWAKWHGHPTHPTVVDITKMLNAAGLTQYSIFYTRPSRSSRDNVFLPLEAPIDQHHYNHKKHGDKPTVKFPRAVYAQMDFIAILRPFTRKQWLATFGKGNK